MGEEVTRRHAWSLRCFAKRFASWSTAPARCYAVSTLPARSHAIVHSCDASTGVVEVAALVVGLRAVVQAAKDVVANVTGCPERECSATTSAWAGTNSAHRVSAPGTERRTQLRFEPVILSNPELGPVIRRYRNVGGKNVTATPTRQPSLQGHDHADGKRACPANRPIQMPANG